MAFKLDLSSTFKYPVKFTTLDALGNSIKNEIKFIFKRFERDQIIDLQRPNLDDIDSGKTADEILETDLDYFLKFVDGWEGVDIGGDTEFNRQNLKLLLKAVPQIHHVISSAFFEGSLGGAARKN